MSSSLADRVAALVAEDGYARLLSRLRDRLERGGGAASTRLRDLDAGERRALADLLGSDQRRDDVVVRFDDIDEALQQSRVGVGLVEVLEELGGPLADHRASRIADQEAWSRIWDRLLARADPEPWRARWVAGLQRGTLRRITDDAAAAGQLCELAERVLARLPAAGVQLAALAAEATGDPHALDLGHPLTVVAQSAVAARLGRPPDQPGTASARRELWAAVGVILDPLSVTTLVLGLRPMGGSLLAATLRAHADAGEPLRLTHRQLASASLHVPGGELFVCENPSVVATAADALGPECRPLLCVEGIPSTATAVLLDALDPTTTIRVHADFDGGGIRIAKLLLARPSARPWRFDSVDYDAALDAALATVSLVGGVDDTPWDPALARSMCAHGRAVHEEQVLDTLLADLAR